eukprot:5766436-Amphidinium_carterae.2
MPVSAQDPKLKDSAAKASGPSTRLRPVTIQLLAQQLACGVWMPCAKHLTQVVNGMPRAQDTHASSKWIRRARHESRDMPQLRAKPAA